MLQVANASRAHLARLCLCVFSTVQRGLAAYPPGSAPLSALGKNYCTVLNTVLHCFLSPSSKGTASALGSGKNGKVRTIRDSAIRQQCIGNTAVRSCRAVCAGGAARLPQGPCWRSRPSTCSSARRQRPAAAASKEAQLLQAQAAQLMGQQEKQKALQKALQQQQQLGVHHPGGARGHRGARGARQPGAGTPKCGASSSPSSSSSSSSSASPGWAQVGSTSPPLPYSPWHTAWV